MQVPPTLTSGGLFAGVDGLGLGADYVFGTKPLWFSEIDPAPASVLAHHHPDVPNLGDVTKIRWDDVPPVDVLHGGFPCQDVSAGGRRRGLMAGTRSGLWVEFARAIEALRPKWVVIENVRGLLTADGEEPHDALLTAEAEVARLARLAATAEAFLYDNPAHRREGRTPHVARWRGVTIRLHRALKRAVRDRDRERRLVRRAVDTVLRDLADLGFDAEWFGLRAADVGAPHARFRVFILAWPATDTVDAADDGQRSRAGSPHGSADDAPDADSAGLERIRRLIAGDGDHLDRRARAGEATAEEAAPADDGGHSVLTLLPTPAVVMNDGEGVETWLARRERVKAKGYNGNGMGMPLPIAVQLLPTPSAALGDGGQNSRSGARKDEPLLGGIAELANARLLPTPEAKNSHAGPDHARSARPASGGEDLVTSIHRHGDGPDWGEYATAIARWEAVIGRPAPAPTRPDGRNGAPRLNPEFVEWMMGWPAGHVTDPRIGLARAAQLKACGNGVVPLQAVIAILTMLARPGVPALTTKEAA